MIQKKVSRLLCALGAAAVAGGASAATINVDFQPAVDPAVANIYTVDYAGTAAAPDAGTVSNIVNASTPPGAVFVDANIGYYDDVDGATSTFSLVDSNGAATGISLTFSDEAGGAFAVSDNAGNLGNIATDAVGLMRDYLIAFGDAQTMTLSGLAPGELVDIYLYGEGDNLSNDRSTLFNANGVIGGTSGDAGGVSLTQGSDYVVLHNVAADANGDIAIIYAANGTPEGPFNGFQVVQIPEPGSLALLGLGGLAMLRRRRNQH